jgi:hypothetical protein
MTSMTRRVLLAFACALVVLGALVQARQAMPDLDTIGPAVGARVPDFAGVDQFGRAQTLQSILGPQGAMLVFFRSADW